MQAGPSRAPYLTGGHMVPQTSTDDSHNPDPKHGEVHPHVAGGTGSRSRAHQRRTDTVASGPETTPLGPETSTSVRLLSGGNPQIAKADGDGPVQAYIAALPGWKRDAAVWLDAVIVATVPDVRKAVKWNTPLYGIEGNGWFIGVHAYARFLKVSFFKGASLVPVPPVTSKSDEVRYLHLSEDARPDDAQMASWVRQASTLPGWNP